MMSSLVEHVWAVWNFELEQPYLCGFNLLTIPFVITWLGHGKPRPLGAVRSSPPCGLCTHLAHALSCACQPAQLALVFAHSP